MKKINSFLKKHQYVVWLGFVLFLFITFFRPVSMVVERKEIFFQPGYAKQYESYKKIYYSSQYVVKKNPVVIPDEAFESFAAGAFLKGLNPILITHDHPPLGRYILSLSVLIFDNQNTIIVVLLFLAALGVFLIGYEVLNNIFLAIIPTAIFINEPLFMEKLLYTPLPEPVQFPFILFSFYFFLRALRSEKYLYWYAATILMVGCVISIRFFITGAVMVLAMVLFLFIKYKMKKQFFSFVLLLPLSLVVLVLSYTRTLQSGYSLLQVFGIQHYILDYHKSKFILPLTFWDLLLLNRWHTWWGNNAIVPASQWIIIWPIATLLSLVSVIMHFLKKIPLREQEAFLCLWFLLQVIVFSTGYTSTRYFLPFLPVLYILSFSFIFKLVKRYRGKKSLTF